MVVVIMIVTMIMAVAVATNLICWNATHGELLSCLSRSHLLSESNDLYELIRLTTKKRTTH